MQSQQPVEAIWHRSYIPRASVSNYPFYTFLLKIASRCNLDCSYCYVYRGADQSWRERPLYMSMDVARRAAERIAEHVSVHGLKEIVVVFHGGEPLLAGETQIRQYAELLRTTIPCTVNLALQTNATLLTEPLLAMLAEFKIKIGISVDGNRESNDRHRVYHNGSSSYDDLLRSIGLVINHPEKDRILGGFLVVIDLHNNPVSVYRTLVDIRANSVDLLLPDCHHDAPPYRPAGVDSPHAYGKWLATFFDLWQGGGYDMEVKTFEGIIALLLGGRSSLESIGANIVDVVVVEADGAIEAVDTLKTVGQFATSLGLNVWNNSFDDAYAFPAVYSRFMGKDALCATCNNCPEVAICSGGYLPHRYSQSNGFQNPSVYCKDLLFLIAHIRNHLIEVIGVSSPLKTR